MRRSEALSVGAEIAPRVAKALWSPWRLAGLEAFRGLETVSARGRSPVRALLTVACSMAIAWWVYVPIHELLHAGACLALGGEVEELEIGRPYGGALLERIVPFVRAGEGYAGRLSRFDTGGSDLVYVATDAAPYGLTVLGAFPLLRRARRLRSAALLGPALVLVAAPVMSLTGDYYEMGSILVTAAVEASSAVPQARLAAMRHDDLFVLLAEFPTRFPVRRLAWVAAIAASATLGSLLAGGTLAVARRVGSHDPSIAKED